MGDRQVSLGKTSVRKYRGHQPKSHHSRHGCGSSEVRASSMTEEGPGFNPRPCQHFSFPVLVKCAHVEFVLTWLTLPDYAVKGMPRHSMRLRLSSSVRMVIPFNSPSKFHFQATHNMHLCILAN